MSKISIKYANDIPPIVSGVYLLINSKYNRVDYVGCSRNVYQCIMGNYKLNTKVHKLRILRCSWNNLRHYQRRITNLFRPRLNSIR
jgi:cell fate (sporulation/competence/biofilm development) regulator YmcA (YheA/YmcA/DUF963 family)